MRFASLGSGSRGNALLIEGDGCRVLIDAGFGPREMARRLQRLGIEPDAVDAVLITHEHSDHVGGAFACARRYGWALHITHGTLAATRQASAEAAITVIDSHTPFDLAGLRVEPFPVPHDAREPVQYVVGDGNVRLGVLTDAGHITRHMVTMLSACEALVLECNHDAGLLAAGPYPPALKRRVGGQWGHLENAAAASLLRELDRTRLRHVIAAHLSEENNRPELARGALAEALGCASDWIGVADQENGFDWRDLR